jgi:hypothetical protein
LLTIFRPELRESFGLRVRGLVPDGHIEGPNARKRGADRVVISLTVFTTQQHDCDMRHSDPGELVHVHSRSFI